MLQEQIKARLEAVNGLKNKVQARLNGPVSRVNEEVSRVLEQLGAKPEPQQSLADVVARIREKNPTLKQLMFNLDAATYDARKQLSWNAHMLSAFALNKAETAFRQDVKPRVDAYLDSAEDHLKALLDKASSLQVELKGKLGKR
ncbi:MAG: hypothetical protein LPK85_13055 [Gammaproteobacteria bacterium]|nr:hypothetical protein [Gammaproteobacteria bacterium]